MTVASLASFLASGPAGKGELARFRFEVRSSVHVPKTVRGLQKQACHFANMSYLVASVG